MRINGINEERRASSIGSFKIPYNADTISENQVTVQKQSKNVGKGSKKYKTSSQTNICITCKGISSSCSGYFGLYESEDHHARLRSGYCGVVIAG